MAVAVVGMGRMGRGIAVACAYAGHPVALIDLKERDAGSRHALFGEARAELDRTLDFFVRFGAIDAGQKEAALSAIALAGPEDGPGALAAAELIFEGVPETEEAKRACFGLLSRLAGPRAVIASTTSTIGVDLLAGMVTVRPERFLNAHWLNPAHLMPLVEVSPAEATEPAAIAFMQEFLKGIGKTPVLCRASPGYIVPRIQAAAINEAARLVEEGVASAADVDTAIRLGFGLRYAVLGLLEFGDWGGIDILYYASRFLGAHIDPHRYAVPGIVERHMSERRRGLRDGIGFHDYRDIDIAAYQEGKLIEFATLLRDRGLMPIHRAP